MKPSYPKSSKTSPSGINVGTWMPSEDARLKEAVARYGARWVLVASEVSTRTGDQCAKRWNENLNPELDHGPWSAVEDKLLLHLVSMYGHDWKFMAKSFFEKRAPLALKNRNSLLKRRQKRQLQMTSSGQQTPSNTESPAPSAPLTPQYRGYADYSNNIGGGLYTDGTDSGTSSPYPRSVMDGDFPLYHQSEMSPDVDLADMFGSIDSTTSSPVMGSIPAVPPHMAMTRTSEPTSAPDTTAWQSFVDPASAFGPAPGDIHSFGLNGYNFTSSTVSEQGPDGSVEYSVTCPRANLQHLVSHLVDAAMTGTSAPMLTDENQVMLTLRLQSV